MKSILRYIFNVLRNISLAIVLLLISVFIYFVFHPEQLIEIRDDLRAESDEAWLREYVDSDDEEESIIASDEEYPIESTISNTITQLAKEITETFTSDIKVELKARNNDIVFLRPSQLVSIRSESPNFILTTIKGQRYVIHNRKYSLDELDNSFNSSGNFFRTKNSLMNLQYVENIFTKGGIKRVRMENLEELDLPEKKMKSLKEEMRKWNQSFNVVK